VIEMIKPRRATLLSVSCMLSLLALLCFGVAPAQAASGNHPTCTGAKCWWYVKANLDPSSAPIGVWSSMTVERAAVQGAVYGQGHSLAAMYVASMAKGQLVNGVEVGWAVSPVTYVDEEPHLFAFVMRNGKQDDKCWPTPTSCGWHAAAGATHHLGEYLQPAAGSGVEHAFGIHYSGGNWWVGFDNQWIGYFAGSYWGSSFTKGTRVSWYGEVEMWGTSPACTAMGDGKYGSQSGSAKIGSMGYWNASGAFTWAHPTASNVTGNANFYNMGNHLSASWMTYGGPGGYTDEYGVDHACV
jgi:hypothetical protein